MMGEYTEFLRMMSQRHENRRKRKNKKLKGLNEKNHRRLKLKRQNDYTLASLEYAGLYSPGTLTGEPVGKHLPGRHDQSTHGNRIGAAYGASHSKSYDITGMAAQIMGHEGYRANEDSARSDRLAARSILRGVRDNKGMRDTLYSGHYVANGEREHKEGDTIVLPIASASGDMDDAQGYAREREQYAGEKRSVIYEFPPGTKAKGYVKNEDPSPEYGMHQWSEALVSGRFEVVGSREIMDSYYHYGDQAHREYPITIYTLRQTHVFDPDTGKWVELVNKRWHFNPNQPRDYRGRWTDTGFGMGLGAPNARRHRAGYVSPFPPGQEPSNRRRATGARAATPAKKTAAKKTTAAPAKKAAAKKTTAPAAKKTTAAPAKKTAAKKTAATRASSSSSNSLYDPTRRTVASRSSIPRINRGGTHIQQHPDGTPIVSNPYQDPGEAYYARNVGPNKITNARLKAIFEDPSKMTESERRMIASAGGAKSLDGEDKITVQTSRGPRELERYKVIGQLRSKIAPGSGDRSAQRAGISSERREKMAAKRRESGKVSSTEFGKISKQISEDWSTDGGKTVPCVFCGKKLNSSGMSIETPKPKALGGNYKDRGGRWPAHETCNTKAGEYAQKDPIAYQEEMMKRFAKLPAETRVRLPHVYDYFPQLGPYPGSAAQRRKYMKTGPKS